MSLILALACILQDESVELLAKKAVAKDEAAAKKILAKGAGAMRPLLSERGRYSGEELKRLDELIFEAKRSSDPVEGHGSLYQTLHSRKMTVSFDGTELQTVLEFIGEFANDRIVVDPGQAAKLSGEKLSIQLQDAPFWLVLDAAARGAGGEWAIRYGAIVISTPDRLWADPPKETRKLTGKELKEVEDLLPGLGADSMEEREKAMALLRELGPGAADRVAQAAESEKDPEIVARCRALLREWAPANGAVLGDRCGIDFQKDEAKFLARLQKESTLTIKISDIALDGALKLMLNPIGIELQTSPATKRVKISLDYKDIPAYTLLALVTKPYGLEFCVKDGKIWVDTADEIRKFLQVK